jgi:hypothetical protein
MEWLVLLVLVPATIVPFVLLFGFAGCAGFAAPCERDGDCPAGTRCVDGVCVAVGTPGGVAETPPSAPEALVANGVSDSEVDLSWTTDDLTVTSFEVQRAEEGAEDDFAPIADPTARTFRDTGLAEGTTYLYQVRAFDGQEFSEPSDQTSATTFPRTPSNLTATPAEVDRIDLRWTNASARATRFSLEHRLTPAPGFTEIFNGPGTTFSHTGLAGGSDHEYRVVAIVPAGFQNGVSQEVRSAPSPPVPARTWAEAFALALTDPQDLAGFCLIQRITAAEFASFPTLLGTIGTAVRVTVRSSGLLTINRIYLSQVAPSPGDPWDSAPDLTRVTDVDQGDPVLVLPASASRVLGPIDYALDRTRDLLVAFDFGATSGQAGVISVVRPGADHYFRAATQAASVADRASDFATGVGRHYLVERIEVL